jgi:HPr kinase/phosphorylase
MEGVSVQRFYEDRQTELELELLTKGGGMDRLITISDINRPGLALAGYTEYFLWERIQIIGQTEISYLGTLTARDRRTAIERILGYDLPCIIIAKGLEPPKDLLALANKRGIPVLRTTQSTTPFIHQLTLYLDHFLAPSETLHGTLVDVYGVGLLFTGESKMGKSELALDLVERGHRLVADDVVLLKRRGQGILIGYASDILQHHMEVRGVGIIDIMAVFGIRAIRLRKRVEVEVRLVPWTEEENYERTGLGEGTSDILGVKIPLVVLPIFPGKNITVVAETVALNHLLRISGIRSAEEFNKRLLQTMQHRAESTAYHEEDLE